MYLSRSCLRSFFSSSVFAVLPSAALLPALALAAPVLHAQSVAHFSYGQSGIGDGLGAATGITTDRNNNVYYFDSQSRLIKATPQNGTYTLTVLATNASGGGQIGVDGAGNVYAYGAYQVVKYVNRNGTYTPVTLISIDPNSPGTLSYCGGLAVTQRGDFYIGECTHYSSEIDQYVLQPDGSYVLGSYGGGYTIQGASLVVDRQDRLSYLAFYTPSLVINGVAQDPDVAENADVLAMDNTGEAYVHSYTNGLLRGVPDDRANGQYVFQPLARDSAANDRFAVMAGGGPGTLFVPGGPGVLKLETRGVDFGSSAVGVKSTATRQLLFTFDATATLQSVPFEVRTGGAVDQDFKAAATQASTACAANHTYNAGETCTVDVEFTPTAAGARKGGVMLMTSSSSAEQPVGYLTGFGVGPQATFLPANMSVVAASAQQPGAVAVDGKGDVFFRDAGSSSGAIQKAQPGAGTYTLSTQETGVGNAGGHIAVDGVGSFYFLSQGSGSAMVSKGVQQASCCQTYSLGSGNGPVGVDGNGVAYVLDGTTLYRVRRNPDATYTQSVAISSLTNVTGLDVDAAANVYVLNGPGKVTKYTLGTNGVYTASAAGLAFSNPSGVAVDGLGNLYVTDASAGTASKQTLFPDGGYKITTIGNSLGSPAGIAVDGTGNLYVTEQAKNRVLRFGVTTPPAFQFASTKVGATSADSPRTMTLFNSGDADLHLSVPSAGTNPSVATNFTLGNGTCAVLGASSSPATLQANQSCTYQVKFTPSAAGSITGAFSLMDDSANVAGSVQSASLSGTGTASTQASQITGPAGMLNFTFGSGGSFAYTVAAATASSYSTKPTGTVQYAWTGSGTRYATIQNGQAVISVPGTLAPGSLTISASYSGDSNYGASTAAPVQVTIKKAQTIVTPPASQPLYFTSGKGGSFAVAISAPYATGYVPKVTGSVTYQVGAGTVQTAPVTNGQAILTIPATLAAGNVAVGVTYGGDANFAASGKVAVQVVIKPAN